MNGALLIHKNSGMSSFSIIENIQRHLCKELGLKKSALPKMGHGGTLDPFATGLLVVLIGKGVKLARYFLGSTKVYTGTLFFGASTISGDPTEPVSSTSLTLPDSLQGLKKSAQNFTQEPYLQVPPMHSAKKMNGKPLYKLAREGIEVDRKPQLCKIYQFDILSYHPPQATFEVICSSGTYIRTLAQDLGHRIGSVAMLESLHRTASGVFQVTSAWTLEQILNNPFQEWNHLPCFIPFHRLLDGYYYAEANHAESIALTHGQQWTLPSIIQKALPPRQRQFFNNHEAPNHIAIFHENQLIAVAGKENEVWRTERVFSNSLITNL